MTPPEAKGFDQYVWYPFTQMKVFLDVDGQPPNIVGGEGCELIDEEGRRYLDGVSSLWCNVHGHRRSEIDSALREQLDRIAHTTLLGLRNPQSEELARKLADLSPPGLRWSFFSDSGSSAVEIALKMAFQYWRNRGKPKRQRYITLGDSYHGDTIGSVSLGGIDIFHRIFSPLLFEGFRVPAPHCKRCPLEETYPGCQLACADLVDDALEERADEIAAVVLEPLVQGAAGIIVHPPGYLARVREACDRHQTLLICDEVATGFGRTGRMFACEHERVTPDLMCLAKGLTGGYLPLAVTLATDEVFDAFLGEHSEGKHFFHGHTFTGNALACSAALASLKIFEDEGLVQSLAHKIDMLQQALEPLKQHPHVFEVRQRGMMIGIELSLDPTQDQPFEASLRMGNQVILEARRHGVIIRPLGDVVVLMPTLAMSDAQLERLVEVTSQSIDEVTQNGGGS